MRGRPPWPVFTRCAFHLAGARSDVRFVGAVDGTVASATLRDGELRLHDLYSGAFSAIVRPHSGDARLTAVHLADAGPPFEPRV